MREGAKYTEFASVSVIEVLHNIPSSSVQKRHMVVVRGKKKKALQKKHQAFICLHFRAEKNPTIPYVCA